MREICAFDFDGTLTTRDTLIAFIRYAKGTLALLWGLLCHTPQLVMMKLGLKDNGRVKEQVFGYFFKGMSQADFDDLCRRFAADSQGLLRPKGLQAIRQAKTQGAEVLIVSASIDDWVAPFFDTLNMEDGIEPGVKIIGTQIEVKDGRLSGRFLTPNCYGQEKVRRILALYPHRETYHLSAYGDSRGDKELLAFADEAYYKPFRL